MGKNFVVRMTGSGAYSIDEYKDGEFKETIYKNLEFKESNEQELNSFVKDDDTSKTVLNTINEKYNEIYGFQDEFSDGLDLDFEEFKEKDNLEEVVQRMKHYCDNYNELRFIDEHNNQYDIDKSWVKENYPDHEILNYKYNDLDTRRTKIKHSIPMNGLQKTFSTKDLVDWMNKFNDVEEFVITYKFDGAACTAIYNNNGEFKAAATRGNGIEGDDITGNFQGVQDFFLLNRLSGINDLDVDQIELRGEILCTKTNFEKHSDLGIKNTRQFAAGSIKLKDVEETKRRELVFAPYSLYFIKNGKRVLVDKNGLRKQSELGFFLNYFNKRFLGNDELNFVIKKGDLEKLEQVIKHCLEIRDRLNVDIDGLVLKIDDYDKQIKYGEDSFMAYKFPSQSSITKVTGITFQVGQTGRITPVVEYEPIDILGVTCSRATIHNSDYFDSYKLAIGDTISVARNGDVIPQVQEIISRSGNEVIKFVEHCEVCGEKLVRDGSFHYCQNHLCGAKSEGKIFSFISSIGLNFLGSTKIQEMIDIGLLKNSYDILYTTYEDLEKLDRMGDRTISKILNSLEQCKKELTFSNILDGLGVQGLGSVNSHKISTYLGELKEGNGGEFNFFIDNLDNISNINGIGGALTDSIYYIISKMSQEQLNYINKVIEDFDIKFDKEEKVEGGKLEGKSFYITGKLSLSRGEFADEYIYKNGGTEESLKKCDYFLAGLNATGWKVEEARNLGKKVINEQEFFELLN